MRARDFFYKNCAFLLNFVKNGGVKSTITVIFLIQKSQKAQKLKKTQKTLFESFGTLCPCYAIVRNFV